jgi:putative peptidoglycan lipid II flippase
MVNKINTVVDKTLASELANGSISSLNYSNIINSLILNIFVIGITTVIYPILSKEFIKKNIISIKIILKKSINIILIVIVPTTIGIMVLSTPIIILFYERGAFDNNATKMTSLALVFYSIGLSGISIRNILDKTFYSFKDTKTPMINGILTVMVNIILNLVLVRFMAHIGLALATSIAEIFGAMLLIISLRKKIGSFSIKFYSKFLMKLGLSASIMGAIVYFIYNSLDYMNYNFIFRLITLLIIILVGAIIYIFLCYILKIEEVKVFFKYIKRRCL